MSALFMKVKKVSKAKLLGGLVSLYVDVWMEVLVLGMTVLIELHLGSMMDIILVIMTYYFMVIVLTNFWHISR